MILHFSFRSYCYIWFFILFSCPRYMFPRYSHSFNLPIMDMSFCNAFFYISMLYLVIYWLIINYYFFMIWSIFLLSQPLICPVRFVNVFSSLFWRNFCLLVLQIIFIYQGLRFYYTGKLNHILFLLYSSVLLVDIWYKISSVQYFRDWITEETFHQE